MFRVILLITFLFHMHAIPSFAACTKDCNVGLKSSMHVAASGMRAQSERLRVVAQNIANSETTGNTPGADPYRRKTISLKNKFNRALGVDLVEVSEYGLDDKPFPMKYDPHHPAADDKGYVKTPNVNTTIENADAREARKAYEANLGVIETTQSMIETTLQTLAR